MDETEAENREMAQVIRKFGPGSRNFRRFNPGRAQDKGK